MSPVLNLSLRRTAEMCATFMIGDGLLGITQPDRHVALWRTPHPSVDILVRPFAGRPGMRRLYGLAQVSAGLALATLLRRPADDREGA